jgi:hypothetical protein
MKKKEKLIVDSIQNFLIKHPELLQAKWRKICKSDKNKLSGHCALAAEVAYWLLGGKNNGWKQYHMVWEGFSHFFIKNVITGTIVDPTSTQYKKVPNYNLGRGCWINRSGIGPTRRATIVLNELKDEEQ